MDKAKKFFKKASNNIRHPQRAKRERREQRQANQQPQQAGPSQAPPQHLQARQSSILGKEDISDLPAGGSPIPQNLHFFWKGESPGRENQEWPHLQQWGNMGEKSAGWNKTLWTDRPSINKWQETHQDKLKELEKMNVNVKPVEKEIDPRNKHVYDYAVNHDARTMASDVARYSVLKNHGGIYADLDITPGNLSLPNSADQEGKEMLSSGRLPLFGPMVRDSKSVLNNTPGSKAPFKERLQETVDKKYKNGEFNNNLIATEPNNQTINLMIDEISKLKDPKENNPVDPKENNPLDINKSDLDQNAPFKTGPHMATRMMRKQMKLEPGPKTLPKGLPPATQQMNSKLKDHLMKNIDLVTDASERDERGD